VEIVLVLLFWGGAIYGLLRDTKILIYLYFLGMPFGTFAVVPVELTKGLTILPSVAAAALLIVKVLGSSRGVQYVVRAAGSVDRLGLLFGFLFVAGIVTAFSPILFSGKVDVIPMRFEPGGGEEPLVPTLQNLSQFLYLTLSAFSLLAFSRILKHDYWISLSFRAIYVAAVVVVITGWVEYFNSIFGFEELLSPLRNASYAINNVAEALGERRLAGLMPEASSYGSLSLAFLSFLLFCKSTFVQLGFGKAGLHILQGFLVISVWMSTSSSAYVGFAFLVMLILLQRAHVYMFKPRAGVAVSGYKDLFIFYGLLLLGVAYVVLQPSILDPMLAMIDKMVLNKAESSSYEERTYWTIVSWNALLDTFGVGVGLGGTRASNSLVMVFSNTGFVGGVLFYGMLVNFYLRKAFPEDAVGKNLLMSLKWAFLPPLFTSVLAGTSADIGLFPAFQLGLMAALPDRRGVCWSGKRG